MKGWHKALPLQSENNMTKTDIENHLKTFIDPHYGVDLITAKAIKILEIDGVNVRVEVELGYAAQSYLETLKADLTDLLKSFPEIGEISVNARVKIASPRFNKR